MALEIVADENIDQPIIDRLRAEGYHVWSIYERARGSSDMNVLAISYRRGAILLTEDKGFGKLVFDQRRPSRAVLLLRIIDVTSGLTPNRIAEVLSSVLGQYGASLFGFFTVVTEQGVRRRPLP